MKGLERMICVVFFFVLTLPVVQAETKDQMIKLELRTIGHEFLMQLNDSTSRVLPVEKLDGRYALRFERNFSFEPSSLSFAVIKVMEQSQTVEDYIVEVENCEKGELLYSFEANMERNLSMIACRQRSLPLDCYTFYFTEVVSKQEVLVENKHHNSSLNYLYTAIFLLVGTSMIYFTRKRKKQNADADNISIGRFLFDQKSMTLTLKEQSISLSGKESDLLLLLYDNKNKTLERDYILSVVWGDSGDYVGRTLDVFISKLRKKLEADPRLKIVNVRGVGYRFVVV